MNIKERRKQRGWTQLELSRRAKLHPSAVSLIENERLRPTETQLRQIAKALGVAPADLAGVVEVSR